MTTLATTATATAQALVLARFDSGEALVKAALKLRGGGHAHIDLHSPFPIAGAAEALELRPSRVPRTVLLAALTGMAVGYLLQLYCNAIDWPINVGNRPPHAFLAFVPITFELTILFGAFGAVFSLLWHCRLPTPWHPTQGSEAFRSATVDGLWLSVPLDPAAWDVETVSEELRALGAREVSVVIEEAR